MNNSIEYALELDRQDPLAGYREQFHIPRAAGGADCVYLCGNSLGLQPRQTEGAILQELEDWRRLGVEGHLKARRAWLPYHELLTREYAALVGAKPSEVVAMNTLTVNLHLMMVSFYRPGPERFKIMMEGGAFPSDQYAVKSQLLFHGYDPAEALVELKPRPGEYLLRRDDILEAIEREGPRTALILLGGVNYYTGQLYPLEEIARAGRQNGCIVGYDLAHAVGNVPLELHSWGIDFACWCSYKYLNGGPGSVAGCFVHQRHENTERPRFAGWWGHDKPSRFRMGPEFDPIPGAEGWQLSNPPILSLAAVKASVDLFHQVGMEALREKSLKLTGYLLSLLDGMEGERFRIISPRAPEERGCQVSLLLAEGDRAVFERLLKAGVVCDWREPDCIRVAPVPFYNSFSDVHRFAGILEEVLS